MKDLFLNLIKIPDGMIMSKFLTNLVLKDLEENEGIFMIVETLVYYSSLLNKEISIPRGFETDLASVPRIPLVYLSWGGKAHREGVLHDYLFRKNSEPVVSFLLANRIILEAMESRGKPFYIRYPIFVGVCVGGYFCYHKKRVEDKL